MKYSPIGIGTWHAAQKILIATCVVGLSGCVFGVTKVKVAHSPLSGGANKEQHATILVKQFQDGRLPQQREHIGNKRNGFGMVLGHIGTQDGVDLHALLTECFAEALQKAGYNAVLQSSLPDGSNVLFDAVLEGETKKFWLDLYMATWHVVDIKLKLKDRAEKSVLWERDIHGEETNVLWIGATGEFERVIRQALDAALNRAVKEFEATEFGDAIKKRAASIDTAPQAGLPQHAP